MPISFQKLQRFGIRRFDVLIHDQSKEWLIENFKSGATKFPVNVTKLIRNIIWQTRERIIRKERGPVKELIRTFWYTHIKPTLARAGALSNESDQYADLVGQLVYLVRDKKLMKYSDIGFRDQNKANRNVGINSHIILFAEKEGQVDYLDEMNNQFQISTIALGGQPSALSVEYFVTALKDLGVNIQRSFFLFSIVDFDPSGWIIRDSFVKNLRAYGIKNIRTTELIHPDMLTPAEIKLARYPVRDKKVTRKKNTQWIKEIKRQGYKNIDSILPATTVKTRRIYGLEAESITAKRLTPKLEQLLPPLLGKSERILRIVHLEKFVKQIDELILINMKKGR